MSQSGRSPQLSRTALHRPAEARTRIHQGPGGTAALLTRTRAGVLALAIALGLAFGLAGCAAASNTITDSLGVHSADPGCIAALKAVSTYGPRAVEDLASGRKEVNKVEVHLLVIALDAAAETADQPADKQAINALASVYEDYYDLKTDAVAVPAADLLRDTTALDSVCKA